MTIWITVLGLMGLLAFAVLMLPAAKRLAFPYTVLLAAVGTLLGLSKILIGDLPILGPINDFLTALGNFDITADAVFFIFLPTLIFEAALSIDVRRLMDDIGPILALAILGLLLSTFTIGYAIEWATAMPFLVCLLIGAICSATDPVAVIALFKEVGAPKRLSILVEGESLFNDATAIVLFTLLVAMIVEGTSTDIGVGLIAFTKVFLGGILLGYLFGRLLCWLMSLFSNLILVNITLSISTAYLSFIVAEHYFHVSGVMAVVVAALVTGSTGRTILAPRHWFELEQSWEQTGFWANSIIFILVGMAVPKLMAEIDATSAFGLIAVIISASAVRLFIAFGMLPVLSKLGIGRSIDNAYKAVMFWGGLRGAVSLALALAIIENPNIDPAIKQFIVVVVTGFVLFTLFINATTIRFVMNFFQLGKLSAIETIMRDRALASSLDKVANQMETTSREHPSLGPAVEEVISTYQEKSEGLRSGLKDHEKVSNEEWQILGLSIMSAQEKRHYFSLFSEGRLQPHIFRLLVAQVDDLQDSLKQEGLKGYNKQVVANFGFDWRFKLANFVHSKFSISSLLSTRLSERLNILLAKQSAMDYIRENHIEKLNRFLGDKIFEALIPKHKSREEKTTQALTALSGQYPNYASTLIKNQLMQSALWREEREYSALLKDGLITQDVFKGLNNQLQSQINQLSVLPELDLHLQPEELIPKVPLFSQCSEQHILEIAALVKPVMVFPDDLIINKGDTGEEMYFIANGAVSVCLENEKITLVSGDFFGEIALLKNVPRIANVKALGYCALLVLSRKDLQTFLESDIELKQTIESVGEKRLKAMSTTHPDGSST